MTPLLMLVVLTALVLSPISVAAQSEEGRSFSWAVARGVLLDPTTYAPALLSYEGMRRDWKTSQVLFANGWIEQNPRFTVSGKTNDVPVSYQEGMRKIRADGLTVLQSSVINNVGAQVAERLLMTRYPHRKKLIRTLSWAERIAFASILAYRSSAIHFRQSSTNRRTARDFGYAR